MAQKIQMLHLKISQIGCKVASQPFILQAGDDFELQSSSEDKSKREGKLTHHDLTTAPTAENMFVLFFNGGAAAPPEPPH